MFEKLEQLKIYNFSTNIRITTKLKEYFIMAKEKYLFSVIFFYYFKYILKNRKKREREEKF